MMSSKQRDVLLFFDNFKTAANTSHAIKHRKSPEVLPPNIGRLVRGEHFSIFKEDHAEEAESVYNFLINLKTYEDFKTHVETFRQVINEGIFMYAVSVACLHRKDTAGILLPPPWQIHPRSYFSSEAIFYAQRETRYRGDEIDAPSTPPLFTTGTVRDTEFKLAWWREDFMLNGHHYHWHQVYPWKGVFGKTKDREGELFYYMHQQLLARYDAERLGVGLMRVEPYVDWSHPIPEGYNPHLTDYYGAYQFSARPANMYLADSWSNPDNPSLVRQQRYHYDRLLDAINTGQFKKDDQTKEDVTIDRLGAAVEASVSSPNMALYGSVHNIGHDLLAQVTDPDGRYKSAGGVMGDNATSARDPIFYRWHKFIDDTFVLHKLNLKPYENCDLALKALTITSVNVKVPPSEEKNVLTTGMKDVTVDISHDMFLDPDEQHPNTSVKVKVKQISHDKFEYNISIESTREMKAAIRIFIAPSFDENGCRQHLRSQRRLFIEMDKFIHNMRIGTNNITRLSTDSSVIKPTNLTYDQLKNGKVSKKGEDECTCPVDRYCECGWPEHMLLPRGTTSGMEFDLFVMATDWSVDKVDRNDNLDRGTSYCGLKNEKYPDRRSMGFPFDRKLKYKTIDDFAEGFSNMFSTPIKIEYTGYQASQ